MKKVVAVACSGGLDSTALLHGVAHWAPPLGISVLALHVHHGLLPEADQWLQQVQRQARRWGAGFACERLRGQPARGDSIEAWARKERYAALTRLAHAAGCGLVMLAQHRRDQAETFLIQALRGGGAAGLAAMPMRFVREGVTFARPWLGVGRQAIEAYQRRHRLRFSVDPSNADERFARARLRSLWPALGGAFADAETTLARAAQRAADDAALIAEVAAADLQQLGASGRPLPVGAWLQLSAARRAAVLRLWLGTVLEAPAPETLVRRLCDELPRASHARWPAGECDLSFWRGWLAAAPAAARRAPPNASGPRRAAH